MDPECRNARPVRLASPGEGRHNIDAHPIREMSRYEQGYESARPVRVVRSGEPDYSGAQKVRLVDQPDDRIYWRAEKVRIHSC